MSEEWKFACQVMLTKGELLQLHVLAGENMSMGDYAAKVLREHAEKKMRLTLGESAASDNESTPAPKQVI